MHFRHVAFRQAVADLPRDLFAAGRARRRRASRSAVPTVTPTVAPAFRRFRHQVDRHRVEHLVAEHHAVERLRKAVQPHDLREGAQRLLLARTQLAGQLDDRIALDRGRPCTGQLGQDVARQFARAGAEFQDARRALGDNVGAHARQRGAEQRRHLRRGCKIAVLAQLGGAAAVIAEAGRVQRRSMKLAKEPAAGVPGDRRRRSAAAGPATRPARRSKVREVDIPAL
jgi:hypothetical protein